MTPPRGVVFIAGGILFFPRLEAYQDIGAWIFFAGSLRYLVVTLHDLFELRRQMNLTAVRFVIGSVLFTVASIPSLWNFNAAHDKEILFSFLAWQYLVGSTFFLLGGVFNYWRAYVLM